VNGFNDLDDSPCSVMTALDSIGAPAISLFSFPYLSNLLLVHFARTGPGVETVNGRKNTDRTVGARVFDRVAARQRVVIHRCMCLYFCILFHVMDRLCKKRVGLQGLADFRR